MLKRTKRFERNKNFKNNNNRTRIKRFSKGVENFSRNKNVENYEYYPRGFLNKMQKKCC